VYMRLLIVPASILLLAIVPAVTAQAKPEANQKYDAKRCAPRVVSRQQLPRPPIHIRKGEKSTGYPPVVAFEIAESGEVINTHVKQTSGIADIDANALGFVQSFRYNNRPGCGAIESEAVVTVDFTSQ
jgi:TonB family protein